MPKWSRLEVKNFGPDFKIRTQKVSEKLPFENRMVRFSDVECIVIICAKNADQEVGGGRSKLGF